MNQKFRPWLRSILRKVGLLPFALELKRNFGLPFVRTYFRSLGLYVFNGVLTHIPIHSLRKFYLKRVLNVRIGRKSFIHMGCRFEGEDEGIRIGNNSVIGRGCVLMGSIDIKDNVSITAETYIFSTSHAVNSRLFESVHSQVVIEDHAWIGARAMILPGVTIGKGAVLAAASTASRSIPDFMIAAGCPAREVGRRSSEIDYTLDYSPFFQ